MKKLKDGWESVRLGDIAITVTSGSRDWAQYYSDTGAKFIRMTNLNRNGITLLLDDLKFVNIQSNSADGKRTSLQANDILISITAELGKIGFIPENFGEAYINQHTALIRIDPNKAHAKFIAYVLSSATMNKTINSLNDAGAKAGLNLPTIKALSLKLPSIEEQIQIAETLSTWDNAIQTTEKLLKNSRQQKKALMQRLLGNEKRRNWKKVIVSEICNIGRGRVISKKEIEENQGIYPVYSSQTLDNGIMGCINSFDFNGEYVTWTTDGVNAGTVFYRNGKFNCTNVCGVLSSKIAELDLKFLAYILSTETYKYVSHTLANPKLMNGIMGSIELELPAIQEQQKIAEIISTADQEIETLQRKLECLKLEKGALMQRFL